MKYRGAGLFVVLMGLAFGASAGNLDVNLGSDAAQVNYSANLTPSGLEGGLGYLHHTDRVDVANLGLGLVGNASPVGSPLLFGVGGKLLFINPVNSSYNGVAVGLGAHFHYVWPSYNRFALGGEIYYAPSIVSFNQADRYLEFSVRAGYSVLRNAEVYIGYRHVSAAFTGTTSLTLDNTFMAGLSLTF
ncbi:MAG TPA: YfaZ family outer membrane protein [Gammaproteobacteria bacterium]|nr:YfaZ family outer membrane protein [Gammaproteobacteria bacterium]